METLKASKVVGVSAFLIATNCIAAPVKLGCFTERVLQKPGIPPVWLVTFDEETKTASLFVKDLGGILNGAKVDISADMILFEFATSDGKKGSAFISRAIGTLMVSVEGSFDRVLANCRKQANAF